MMCNSIPARVCAYSICACLAACAIPVPVSKGSSSADYRVDPGAELERQADAMTRTMGEAVMVGVALSGAASLATGGTGRSLATNMLAGAAGGVAGGGYVGYLQKKYATNEARLAKLKTDVDEANRNALASIQTLERLVASQNAQIAEARASGDQARIKSELAAIRENQSNAGQLIAGYQRRHDDFASTRALKLVSGGGTGVDPEIAMLSQRISAMRQVAQSLHTSI
jgi:hypothetical protein